MSTRSTMKIQHFTVTGKGYFPLDMLRHDCCWPTGSEDAAAMSYDARFDKHNVERMVKLSTICHGPCEGRWNSFGWFIVQPKYGRLGERS